MPPAGFEIPKHDIVVRKAPSQVCEVDPGIRIGGLKEHGKLHQAQYGLP